MNILHKNISSHNSIYLKKKIVQSATIQEKSNFYHFPKHIHENIEIYYIIKGSCKMDIIKETVIAQDGDMVMILPNTVHSFYLDSDKPCKFIHIHFDAYNLNSLFASEEKINIDSFSFLYSINHYYKLILDKNMIALLYSIINEAQSSSQFSEILCNLHLVELLIYFMKKQPLSSLFLTSESPTTPSYVFLAFDYIKQNYSEKILISDISNHLNISPRYLSKLFYESTNLTILQYLNIYRINQAIYLMTNTNNSLTDISLNVGLGDIQHFSKLFKNIIGVNPRKYRQLLIK